MKTNRIQQLVREPIAVVAYDRDGPNCDPQKITRPGFKSVVVMKTTKIGGS